MLNGEIFECVIANKELGLFFQITLYIFWFIRLELNRLSENSISNCQTKGIYGIPCVEEQWCISSYRSENGEKFKNSRTRFAPPRLFVRTAVGKASVRLKAVSRWRCMFEFWNLWSNNINWIESQAERYIHHPLSIHVTL